MEAPKVTQNGVTMYRDIVGIYFKNSLTVINSLVTSHLKALLKCSASRRQRQIRIRCCKWADQDLELSENDQGK